AQIFVDTAASGGVASGGAAPGDVAPGGAAAGGAAAGGAAAGGAAASGLRLTGLLDVDSAGPGHRVDDLACLLGHMSVLPLLDPEAYRLVPGTFARWLAAADALVDPAALRARAAGVVLSLVAGARGED